MPVVGAAAVFYFAYHAVQGERGLLTMVHLGQQIDLADRELATVQAEREALERRVRLLRAESLDRDMLDERARATLGLIGPNEMVIEGD